jgi:methylthioribose-1-phosphate isomerase
MFSNFELPCLSTAFSSNQFRNGISHETPFWCKLRFEEATSIFSIFLKNMKVQSKHFRTIWPKEENHEVISIIDQRYLPHEFVIEDLHSVNQVVQAIKEMHVRGAGLIGAAAGYGMYLAAIEADENPDALLDAAERLKASRPTAVNLEWAVRRQLEAMSKAGNRQERISIARDTAALIADEDAEYCKRIGIHGVSLIEALSKLKKGKTVNILTHCNAGWLAFIDYGSATAPIYEAFARGIDIHVWVDETRPRNQGASLTAWELANQGVPYTVIVDNAGGHLMQHEMVDMIITGADRVTRGGDVANKIGTYLKALAAYDNNVPFYVALPSSTFDWNIIDGVKDIPIEERNADEVKYVYGLGDEGPAKVLITPPDSRATNYAFDVTPARLVTGLITERGICRASEEHISNMFSEKVKVV